MILSHLAFFLAFFFPALLHFFSLDFLEFLDFSGFLDFLGTHGLSLAMLGGAMDRAGSDRRMGEAWKPQKS